MNEENRKGMKDTRQRKRKKERLDNKRTNTLTRTNNEIVKKILVINIPPRPVTEIEERERERTRNQRTSVNKRT